MKKGTKVVIKLVICVLLVAVIAVGIYFVGKIEKDAEQSSNENLVSNTTVVDDTNEPDEETNNNINARKAKKTDTPKLSTSTTPEILTDLINDENVSFYMATLDGDIAYSLDYGSGTPLPTGTLTFRSYISDQLMAIMANGYSNSTPESLGCTTKDEAYSATQMAIWEVANRTGESKKASELFRVNQTAALVGNEESYNRIVAAAKKLVNLAENEPLKDVPTMVINNTAISLTNINGNDLIGPYTVTLEGLKVSNEKNIKASLVDAPKGAILTDIDGNEKNILSNGDSVYVKIDKTLLDTCSIKIRFESSVDRKVGAAYESSTEDAQDFIRIESESATMEKDLTINWTKTTTLGKIELSVIGKDEKDIVIGAKFQLIDSTGKSLGEVETGTDGKITFYSVPVGDYTLKEISTPKGYTIKEETKKVTVKGGEMAKVTFEN